MCNFGSFLGGEGGDFAGYSVRPSGTAAPEKTNCDLGSRMLRQGKGSCEGTESLNALVMPAIALGKTPKVKASPTTPGKREGVCMVHRHPGSLAALSETS